LLSLADAIFFEQAVECAAADAKCSGRAGLVAAVPAVGGDDVLPRERVEVDVARGGDSWAFVSAGYDLGGKFST
jgi:hypothetical protein